ncbi:hypothetical protein [Streptomyces sp. NPDC054866]
MPTVMERMPPGALAAVVTDKTRRAEHIEELLRIVRSRAYDGIDLDYESIAPTGDSVYKKVSAGYATMVGDRLRVMAYDQHWAEGSPGPLSSPAWYDEILRRATAEVPAAKLEMGLPGYGWDWQVGSRDRARHVTWKEAEALRRRIGAPYRIDPKSSTPHFTYTEGGKRRTVWYQDARGTAAHLPVLRKYGVRHTVLWAIGFEDPALWRTLATG